MKAEKHLALWGDSALTACLAAEEFNTAAHIIYGKLWF